MTDDIPTLRAAVEELLHVPVTSPAAYVSVKALDKVRAALEAERKRDHFCPFCNRGSPPPPILPPRRCGVTLRVGLHPMEDKDLSVQCALPMGHTGEHGCGSVRW